MIQSGSSKKRVSVGLSGGVDSSVAAALLKRGGHSVTGVFIKVWYPDFLECTWKKDQLDAMRVCAKLEIPFRTLDLAGIYKRDVADSMIREYRQGRTPNPDVMCNTHIKFGAFLNDARKHGADYIATGHYIRSLKVSDKYHLYTAADTEKDQSYFLWGLGQSELKHALFPLADFQKKYVRGLATSYGLPTAAKKDSQGLCFLGKLDMKEFLSHYIQVKPGEVVNAQGKVIGMHDGAFFYTYGQRHGFRITSPGEQEPHYVIDKNLEQNTLTVITRAEQKREDKMIRTRLQEVHWVLEKAPKNSELLFARVRYRQPLVSCRITPEKGGELTVHFLERAPLTPPGQSLVLYKECDRRHELLGGGVIV